MRYQTKIDMNRTLIVAVFIFFSGFSLLMVGAPAAGQMGSVVLKSKAKNEQMQRVGKKGSDNADADLDEVKIEELDQNQSTPEDDSGSATDKLLLEDVVEPEMEYHYAAFNQADPFLSPLLGRSSKGAVESVSKDGSDNEEERDENVTGYEIPLVSSLQRYKIDQLELKGIWRLDTGEKRAMILTPERQGIIVKEDDPIASGKIIGIDDRKITVRLYHVDNDGSRVFDDEKMYLGKPPVNNKGILVLKPGKEAEFIEKDNKVVKPKAVEDNAMMQNQNRFNIPNMPGAAGLNMPAGQPGGAANQGQVAPVGAAAIPAQPAPVYTPVPAIGPAPAPKPAGGAGAGVAK